MGIEESSSLFHELYGSTSSFAASLGLSVGMCVCAYVCVCKREREQVRVSKKAALCSTNYMALLHRFLRLCVCVCVLVCMRVCV